MRGFLTLLGLIAMGCVLYFCTQQDMRKEKVDIRQQVISQLKNDTTTSYDFIMSDVELMVSEGNIILQGSVVSDAIRQQIETSVKKVRAVRSIDNQLVVQPQKVADNPPVAVSNPRTTNVIKEPETQQTKPEPVKTALVKTEQPKEIITPPVVTKAVADECDKEFATLLEKETIQFNSGKATVKPSSQPLLNKLVDVAKGCAGAAIDVHGYTDSTGNIMLNKALSSKRAQTVVDYFVSQGVKAVFKVYGHGPENPIASNKTAKGRAKNRRIEFDVRVLQ